MTQVILRLIDTRPFVFGAVNTGAAAVTRVWR